MLFKDVAGTLQSLWSACLVASCLIVTGGRQQMQDSFWLVGGVSPCVSSDKWNRSCTYCLPLLVVEACKVEAVGMHVDLCSAGVGMHVLRHGVPMLLGDPQGSPIIKVTTSC
jgi:hypothetical protein